MSTLLIDELYPDVVFEQPFKIKKSKNIRYIRPWVYKHNQLLDGQFKLTVLDGSIILKEVLLEYGIINSEIPGDYSHGFMRVDFDSLQLNVPHDEVEKEYILRFEMINHTRNTGAFIGIVRNWDIKIYDTYGIGVVNNQAPNDSVEPGGIEIYTNESID